MDCSNTQSSMKLQASNDLGGHGGTYTSTVVINGKSINFFCKPLPEDDPTEAINYRLIYKMAPELIEFMPKFYRTKCIEGKKFIVLENILLDSKNRKLTPLADIKLAGLTPDIHFYNPICNQQEMLITRGKPKIIFDFVQMMVGAHSAPGYMIAQGNRCTRILHYKDSDKHLNDILSKCDSEKVTSLLNSLKKMRHVLLNSPIALVGASIFLVQKNNGDIKPVLIDPAHMMLCEDKKPQLNKYFHKFEREKIYVPDKKAFFTQKHSNDLAFNSLLATISKQLSVEHFNMM